MKRVFASLAIIISCSLYAQQPLHAQKSVANADSITAPTVRTVSGIVRALSVAKIVDGDRKVQGTGLPVFIAYSFPSL